jgi:hypothetical protein
MPKKPVKAKNPAIPETKRLVLPNDQPIKIDIPFEDAVKKALNTHILKGIKSDSTKKLK